MLDLIIIGGGPAGVTAGIYAARKKLKTVLITGEFGGQSNVSEDIQNWIGTPHISGADLAKNLEAHLRENEGDSLKVDHPALAEKVEKIDDGFKVTTNKGESYEATTLLYAAGSVRRKLQAKGADEYEHKGLTYCATCDGPLFTGRDVIVVGGGNSAFETASQLSEYTKSVTIIDYSEQFFADAVTVEKVTSKDNITALSNAEILEVKGDAMVNGLVYKDRETGEETTLETGGIFVEIGMIPNTAMVKDLDVLTERNTIEVDPWTQQTKVKGFWAAGDCTNVRYHQNGIAMGDATKAIEDIYAELKVK